MLATLLAESLAAGTKEGFSNPRSCEARALPFHISEICTQINGCQARLLVRLLECLSSLIWGRDSRKARNEMEPIPLRFRTISNATG